MISAHYLLAANVSSYILLTDTCALCPPNIVLQ